MTGDILDEKVMARLVTEYEFETIYHLAALLSTRSEFSPELAHQVNVDGTLALLQVAAEQSQRRGRPVSFIFPSSVAAYGVPSLEVKARDRRVKEWQWNNPTTMYGCNKLYCEQLGIYYSKYYQQLAANRPVMLDFRSLRFPGLISAYTMPLAAQPTTSGDAPRRRPGQALCLLRAPRQRLAVHDHARRRDRAAPFGRRAGGAVDARHLQCHQLQPLGR